MTTLVIDQPECERLPDGRQRLAARIDGRVTEFILPGGITVLSRGEAFLSIALLPAMLDGRKIVVDPALPVSPLLAKQLTLLQRIRRQWNPGLRLIEIEANLQPAEAANADIVSTSFSGGVDSNYTLIRHADITHLYMTTTFDAGKQPADNVKKARMIGDIAARNGRTPLFVETNARKVFEAGGMSWNFGFGNIMAGLFAGLGVRRHYLPSSYSYRDLHPYGSHILTDPLWSTEATEILHDGLEALRSEKTEAIAAEPSMLDHLQVCWRSGTENCGECSKCIRTRIVLDVLGREGPFPDHRPTLSLLARLQPEDGSTAEFVWDLREFARRHDRSDLASVFDRQLRRYMRRRSLAELVRISMPEPLMRLSRKFRGLEWTERRITLPDTQDYR